MTSSSTNRRVVVIGGGTGTSVVAEGLKSYPVSLTSIVSAGDSGGSSGRLRDEFGFLPVGDMRQVLAASATLDKQKWIRKLFLYRFSKGDGLKGHNLGNLILTALQDMTGSTPLAVETAASIFRLDCHVYPSTTKNIQIVTEYENGQIETGEHILDEKHGGERIISIQTRPKANYYSKAKSAIQQADIVVIGPGDLYGSLMPNLVLTDTKTVFAAAHNRIVYILNLMTHYTQTHHMTAMDHVRCLENALGRHIDTVIVNTAPIPSSILAAYRSQHEFPVIDDIQYDTHTVIRGNFIRSVIQTPMRGDAVRRSFLRHDPGKIAKVVMSILNKSKA